ncbi:hypothetical protein ACJ2A9_06180 [Anaerobacillus sp. MEB173]|uniref:hypothetical protein n=1 Tax=Anaerobacillus sp. MEB173 TaxID=3383345 RepID=UPI003F91C9F6
MIFIDKRIKKVKGHGDIILSKKGELYALVLDNGERYPYHLISLDEYVVIQSFDKIPTNKEIEDEIEAKIDAIFNNKSVKMIYGN